MLLYDGACSLCRRAAARLAVAMDREAAVRSFRDEGALRRFPRLDVDACASAIQLVRKDGVVFAGVEALVQALRARWYGRLLRRVYYLPGVRYAAEAAYAAVAHRRFRLSHAAR